MMTKIFHLCFTLDTIGDMRWPLVSFHSLKELDDFIRKNFASHKDVRKRYDKDISEICLVNRKKIEEDNERNNRNWTGSIVIIAENRNRDNKVEDFHKISVIYKNDPPLLPRDECFQKIKDNISRKIDEVLDEKSYLISNYEKAWLKSDGNPKRLIRAFLTRIKHSDDELFYYYSRCLMRIFKLNEKEINTKYGKISSINVNDETNYQLISKPTSYSDDGYFNSLIDDCDYENLFNYYDVDEIDKYTDYFDMKKRGK